MSKGRLIAVVMDRAAQAYVGALAAAFPQVEFRAAQTPGEAMPLMADADVLIALAPYVSRELIAAGDRLQWVQALTTGVDNLMAMPELKAGVAITNTRGIHGPQMSEMAFAYMLNLARDWRRLQANQEARAWERFPQPLLWNKTLTVVGLGVIAEALARRAKAFDMNVVGVSASPRPVAGFDKVVSRDRLAEAMGEADFVVVLAPYSPGTHHLIDGAAIAAMKPTAYLINLARGGVIDEAALLEALDEGRIAGAGLDVFATEPLPADSPWWSHPKVLMTPHVGGASDVYEAQVLPIVEANLAAFLAGGADDLQNRVAREGTS